MNDRIPHTERDTGPERSTISGLHGFRGLTRPLHMATITRMRRDPDTRAYVERRRTEGRTPKEIRRILKRYLARQIYRTLNTVPAS